MFVCKSLRFFIAACFLSMLGVRVGSAQTSRPLTTEAAYGSKLTIRSSYSALSSTAKVREAYQTILGRPPAVYEASLWLRNSKPGLQSRVQIELFNSPEFFQRIGSRDEIFVSALYKAILRRSPLASELSFQLGRITSQAVPRAQVAKDLVFSCEHAGILAQEAYSLLLGRNAPPNSSAVWCPGVQSEQLDILWLDLLSSDEYYVRNGGTPRGFVLALYRDLLWRGAGEVEIAAVAKLIVSGQLTRRQTARIFLDSGEFSAYWVNLCPGQWVDASGHLAADSAINSCIASPEISRIDLPGGEFRLESGIKIGKSDFILTTENLFGSSFVCEKDFPACARLIATEAGGPQQALLHVPHGASRVTIDHITVDGNREKRFDVAQSFCPLALGRNIILSNGDDNQVRFSASVNALCGTALAVGADGSEADPARRSRIVSNYIHNNGWSFEQAHGLWSDGMTVAYAPDSMIRDNYLSENTDVALIIGNSPRAIVAWNTVIQRSKPAFAGIMDTNWKFFEPSRGFGDSRGLIVYGNRIDCGEKCDFAIHIGLGAWADGIELDKLRIMGGWYEQNVIASSKQGINVDLAGTPDFPTTLVSNSINRLGHGHFREGTPLGYFSLPFTGVWKGGSTSAINVVGPGDRSFVSTGGEVVNSTNFRWP